MSVNGYMLFKAEFEGREPHPDNAPQEDIDAYTAKGFSEAYSVYSTREEAGAAATDDHETVLDAVARGDMFDADEMAYILPVSINEQGEVTVFEEDGEQVIRVYTVNEMYEGFFGMVVPTEPGSGIEP